MTAQEIIESTLPLISGSKISKEDNYDTLLRYLNFAKGKLARDTHLWIGGDSIELIEGQNEYILSKIPIQIVEVYDNNYRIRPRNKFDTMGYTQLAPNKIYVNTIEPGVTLNLNWFEEPADFALGDEVFISSDLIEAMQFYVAYKVFNVYKGDQEELKTKLYLDQYKTLILEYRANTDTQNIDSIYGNDMIFNKGLV